MGIKMNHTAPSPTDTKLTRKELSAALGAAGYRMRIAKRGYPGTAQAGTWVSLEPGWRVLDTKGKRKIVVEYDGERATMQ
jgi:hypothetical protein